MIPELLTLEERQILLRLARESINLAVNRKALPKLNPEGYSPPLRENGASFVTLTENGELCGCIGALEAYQPLILDVQEHAVAAALEDYRFSPVRPAQVSHLQIEISRLTAPQRLEYQSADELVARLRPGVDGVTLRDGMRRATFLPQVWEKLPNAAEFLSHLCQKMGAPANLWRQKILQAQVYQVEEFHEQV